MKSPHLARLATSCLLSVPCLSHADVLGQYNFGPNGVGPGVLSPATTGLHLTTSNITGDAGLVLDLTSPATQPAPGPICGRLSQP